MDTSNVEIIAVVASAVAAVASVIVAVIVAVSQKKETIAHKKLVYLIRDTKYTVIFYKFINILN